MAKPIKKNKSRSSLIPGLILGFILGRSGRNRNGSFLGFILITIILLVFYCFYVYNPAIKAFVDHYLGSAVKSFKQNTLQTSGIAIIAIGGLLWAFIFNKK